MVNIGQLVARLTKLATKCLISVPFALCIMFGFQENITKHTKNILSRDGARITTRFRCNNNIGIIRPGIQTTMINKLESLLEQKDNKQRQMGNVSRVMDILKKYSKEMLEINTVT